MSSRDMYIETEERDLKVAVSENIDAQREMVGAEEPDRRTRMLLMSIRQALIIALGGVEDYLGLPRSIVPRRKKN